MYTRTQNSTQTTVIQSHSTTLHLHPRSRRRTTSHSSKHAIFFLLITSCLTTTVVVQASGSNSIPRSTGPTRYYPYNYDDPLYDNDHDTDHDDYNHHDESLTSDANALQEDDKPAYQDGPPPWNPSKNIDEDGFLKGLYRCVPGEWESPPSSSSTSSSSNSGECPPSVMGGRYGNLHHKGKFLSGTKARQRSILHRVAKFQKWKEREEQRLKALKLKRLKQQQILNRKQGFNEEDLEEELSYKSSKFWLQVLPKKFHSWWSVTAAKTRERKLSATKIRPGGGGRAKSHRLVFARDDHHNHHDLEDGEEDLEEVEVDWNEEGCAYFTTAKKPIPTRPSYLELLLLPPSTTTTTPTTSASSKHAHHEAYDQASPSLTCRVRQVPGDGNCLFHSVAACLRPIVEGKHVDVRDVPKLRMESRRLRHLAVDALGGGGGGGRYGSGLPNGPTTNQHHHSNTNSPTPSPSKHSSRNRNKLLFLQGDEWLRAGELVDAAASQYNITAEEYCTLMRRERYWGGGPEIVALCNVLRRPIHVYELCVGTKPTATSNQQSSTQEEFCLRRMACFGSPKFDRKEPFHILSADSRFPDVSPGKQLASGNHFLALFPYCPSPDGGGSSKDM